MAPHKHWAIFGPLFLGGWPAGNALASSGWEPDPSRMKQITREKILPLSPKSFIPSWPWVEVILMGGSL